MQVKVEKSTEVEKFKPIELTIKVTIEKGSELLAVLEDEKLLEKGKVCNHEGDYLSDVCQGVVSAVVKIVAASVD